MKRSNGNVNFDIPAEYCGQGVSVESTVSIKSDGGSYVKTTVKDGTGKDIGTFVLSDDRRKAYLDLSGTDGMKRQTLVAVIGKLKETLEFALAEQIAAEREDAPADGGAAAEEAAEE